jgi:hypothetical protein
MNFKLATLAAAMLVSAPAFADNTNGPNPYAAGFGFDTPTEASWGGWTRGDAGTLYAEWDTFTDLTHGASNDRTAAPDVGQSGATGAHIAWNNGTFRAGSGNLYSFSGIEFFQILATGGPASGPVRAVLQTENWGNGFDLSSIKLNGVAPTTSVVTFTDPAYNSSFGPVTLTERLFIWELASAPASFTFDLASASPDLSFAQVAIDIAAAPVPEPETYAMLAVGLGLVGWQVRRRNKSALRTA